MVRRLPSPQPSKAADSFGDVRKVVYVLEELSLEYDTIYLRFDQGDHQKPEFTRYNPNGRVPALIDHGNRDYVIW